MSKKYISPEHAIRDIMLKKSKLFNEEIQLDEFSKAEAASGILDAIRKGTKKAAEDLKGFDAAPSAPIELPNPKKIETIPPVEAPQPPVEAPTKTPLPVPPVPIPLPLPAETPAPVPDKEKKAKPENKPNVDLGPVTRPSTGTTPAPGPAPAPAPAPGPANNGNKNDAKETAKTPRYFTGSTPGQSVHVTSAGTIDVGNYLHRAGDRRTFEEETRQEIVNVPRPNSSREKTMTKNQEIKNKIIDETNRKKQIVKNAVKEYSVNLNPEYKNEKLSEAQTATTAFGRGFLDSATFGAGKYGRAATDYTLKNVGSLVGLSKPTTWEKETQQEYEKDAEAKAKHGTAFGAGGLAADAAWLATGAGGLARAGAKQAIKMGMKPAAEYGSTFAKKLIPGAIETGFTKTGIEGTKEKMQQGDYKGAAIEALGTAPIIGTVGRVLSKTPETLKTWQKIDTGLNAAGVAPFVPQIPKAIETGKEVGSLVYQNPEIVPAALKYTAQELAKGAKERYFPSNKSPK